MKSMKALMCTGAATLLLSATGNAHTIAQGINNAGAPGSVRITLGSYHSTGGAEGSITLTPVGGGPSQTVAFGNVLVQNAIPYGLTSGVDLFYSPNACCGSPAGSFPNSSNGTGQTLRRWQSAVFSGLSAGDYDYQITGMNSVIWADWASNTANWSGTLTISGAAAGPVPDAGSTGLMLGLPLLAMVGSRLRRKHS